MVMDKDLDEKTMDYIDALEKAIEELTNTLEDCIGLLAKFKSSVSDPQDWQKMLDLFYETIVVAERTVEKKTLH